MPSRKVASVVLGGTIFLSGVAVTNATEFLRYSVGASAAADTILPKLRAQWAELQANKYVNIPVNLRVQFERFMLERQIAAFRDSHSAPKADIPPMVAETNTTPVRSTVEAQVSEPTPPAKSLIRLAAAGPIDCYLSDAPAERTATAVIRAIVPAAKPDRALPISAAPPPTNRHFEIGDKLKLVFFENVQDVEKNKWGNAAGSGFQQHPELTGDYVVQDDGTISVPVLGSFDIVDLSQKEIQNEIGKALDKALGRIGFVTIVSVERPPIYVLGPVKNPGSYTYSQGMTVLHALTLAGGFPKKDVEPWQEMEQVRETAKRYGTLESLAELLTRQAVLRAERDRTTPTTPQPLVELVGPTKAAAMIAAEVDRRSAIVAARNARLQSAADAVKAAQQEVELLSTEGRSLESMDDNIAALKKRAAGIQQLYEKGQLATNNMIIETKTRVADAERNRQDMVIQLAQGKQRLTTAQQEQAKLEADIRGEIETESKRKTALFRRMFE